MTFQPLNSTYHKFLVIDFDYNKDKNIYRFELRERKRGNDDHHNHLIITRMKMSIDLHLERDIERS